MSQILPFPDRRVLARYSAIVLGGGLSGLAAAHRLAREGWKRVLVVERGPTVGGLAGSFEREGHWYPLGYHHILQKDRTLQSFLTQLGIAPKVQWRRIRVLFEIDGRLHDLGSPEGFARFPMALASKLRFVKLMLRAFAKSDWSEWEGRPARELLDAWGGPAVRERLFEPLCRLKFQRPSDDVSAAWLGARLHFREGATPLGYTPGASWTKLLCDGMGSLVEGAGVEVRTNTAVTSLEARGGRIASVTLGTGERIGADVIVNTLPPPTYLSVAPGDETPRLQSIRYTALLSAVCAAPLQALPPFYWLNVTSPGATACGIFRLDALNPTIGRGDEMCINFVTHLPDRGDPLFSMSDAGLTARYLADYARVFGRTLEPSWINIARVPMYSPVFDRAFRNPPVQSATWPNVYFAGNYRTFPSVASTGTALESGIVAAERILRDRPRVADLPKAA